MKKEKKIVKLHKKSVKSRIKECIASSFILLFSFLIILLFSPLFNITKINVEGNLKVSENIIKSESGINIGQNILRLNKIKIKEDLLKVAYLEDIEIRRAWPDTIMIKVTEKSPVAMIKFLGSNILIDENAYILEIVTDFEEQNVPLLVGIETSSTVASQKLESTDEELLEKFLEILKNLKNNDMLKKIEKIEKNEGLFLYTYKNQVINLGDTTDLSYKLMRVKAIIDDDSAKNSFIDVSNVNVWTTLKPLWD